MEIAGRVGQMHGDDAVFRLADRAAPLPFDTGRFVPVFHITGLVDDADRIGARVVPDHDLLQAVSSAIFFPLVRGQELLQVSRGDPGGDGDRLAAFFAKVGQLPLHIGGKMSPRILAGKTLVELYQVSCEHRFQLANLFGIHAEPSILDGYSFAKLAVLRNINPAQ